MLGDRRNSRSSKWIAYAWILATILKCESALAQPRLLYELHSSAAFQGPVQTATVDSTGVAWIATPRQLYKVELGRPILVDSGATGGSKLAFAPGGRRYGRLLSVNAQFGLFTVELLDPADPSRVIATLRDADPPYGFSDIHLGREGKLIVTVTPTEDAEGLSGQFAYGFWSDNGLELGKIKLDGPSMGSIDEEGEAILLFGESGVAAIRRDARRLWSLPTSYRKGVLAGKGNIALLNPTNQIDEVHVVRGGAVTVVKFGSPVHELAITPDGSLAAVATDGGRVSLLKLHACDANACSRLDLPTLPLSSTHYVSGIRFVDRGTLAITAFEATGAPPNVRYDNGFVFLVSTAGTVLYRRPIALPQPPTWNPFLTVEYDMRNFAVYTRESALFLRGRN